MRNTIRTITNKGIRPGMTPYDEKGVIISNYIILLAVLVSFARIFMFFISGDWFYSIISIIAASSFLFAYYMNTKQHYLFAKYFIMIAGNSAILIKELMSGGTGNQLYLVIASYGVIFFLFSIKDKLKIIIAFMIPTANLLISVFLANMISQPVVLDPNVLMLEKLFGVFSAVVIIIAVIWYFVKQSTESEMKLINSNNLLQNYNNEISEQKSLIEVQYLELEQINYDLIIQKKIIEDQHTQLTDSIQYASTIQNAILPWKSTLNSLLGDVLICYKPKDIVSGDSYWFKEIEGVLYIAVIDCTGHGIPGAMLTVIASTALDDAVLSKRILDTADILTYINYKVTDILNQKLTENKIRDGMEIALIAIHKDKIQFSGAGRPLFYNNGTFQIVRTDKRGIAGQSINDDYQFSSIEIDKVDNMMLYLTSDGFQDQMNEQSKKYSTKRFITLLESISSKTIMEQSEIIESEFIKHRGSREQIDDITIVGIRI